MLHNDKSYAHKTLVVHLIPNNLACYPDPLLEVCAWNKLVLANMAYLGHKPFVYSNNPSDK